jgi:hypothetical protein
VRARAAVALLAAVAGGLTACDNTPSGASTEPPFCSHGESGVAARGVVLMAQSVPTASWIPCLRTTMPQGWGFHHMEAGNGSSRFWLDSDRDGQQAIGVGLTATCDVDGTTEIPTDRPGLRRLERVSTLSPHYAGQRFYLFSGGCLTFTFRLTGDSPGEALALAAQSVGVVSRTDLQSQVRRESHGRLSLDPPPGGEG